MINLFLLFYFCGDAVPLFGAKKMDIALLWNFAYFLVSNYTYIVVAR